MNAGRPRTVPPAATIIALAEAGSPPCYPARMSLSDRVEVAAAMAAFIQDRDMTIPQAARFIGIKGKSIAQRCAAMLGIRSSLGAIKLARRIGCQTGQSRLTDGELAARSAMDAKIIAARLAGAKRREIAASLAVTLNRVDDAFARATPGQKAEMDGQAQKRVVKDREIRQRLADPKPSKMALELQKRRSEPARQAVRIDPDEASRLIAEAIAAGRVTRCPPAAAAPVNQGMGFAAKNRI